MKATCPPNPPSSTGKRDATAIVRQSCVFPHPDGPTICSLFFDISSSCNEKRKKEKKKKRKKEKMKGN